MSGVELSGVSKRFGPKEVLLPTDLRVEPGELLVLVGPSGCGKTTVLRLVAGLEEASTGRILIGGRDVTHLPPKDRNVAMVFQNYALYPHMTVAENLGFALKIARLPKDEITRRVQEVARQLDIAHLLDAYPRMLSGGQRQRVALGRAMVRNPAVFLFDEPLSNIDAKLRVQTRAEIAQLQRRLRTTTLYVTHDQVEAMTLGHRIAVMREGRLQQVGPPLEVYRFPVNTFVATFIGSPPMNLLPGQVAADGRHVQLEDGGLLPLPEAAPELVGAPVLVGIRPEHLRLASEPQAPLRLAVEVVEPVGGTTYLGGSLGGRWFVAGVPPDTRAAPGDRVPLAAREEHLLLFSREHGERLLPRHPR